MDRSINIKPRGTTDMTMHKFNNVTVECIQGNIADQPDVEAVVNAANAWLRTGGGVAGALHRAAGSGLEEECRPLAPIRPGMAVITGGHRLPNRFVIHCLGPVYGRDEPSDELLAACYRNALLLAEQKGITSIAFPSLSTGAFGFPMEPAAWIAFRTVMETAPELETLTQVRFVLYSAADQALHARILEEIAD
jgi:O-acetyl-ADP-ribose deacetylase (regulator of RNase III)